MNDLLWLVNLPLWGNVMCILTSRNPDAPEGLENRLSIIIHRIPVELPHLTESSSPQNLASLSTLQEWTWEHYRGLNLTFFTLSDGASTMAFIGVRQCCGWILGAWGPLVRPAVHATWSGGLVSSLHRLLSLDTLSTASPGYIDKTVFESAPTHGQLATPWLGWARTLCHVISLCHIVCDYALFCT
jgi:hypothetical protein